MSNGAIDSRRATLPTKFAVNRAAAQNVQSVQKKYTVSLGNSGKQASPRKSHEVPKIVNSATSTAPIYARVREISRARMFPVLTCFVSISKLCTVSRIS